ncbi:MAG TPA: hypothetical protein GX405_03305 [Rhizobiales bacterium]|nr:hypothetical protein [Hyphomicrobiales bacterium]
MASILKAVRSYARNDDPLAEAANAIALLVASSQPFYPLYVYWSVGPTIWPTAFTFLSTPFFLLVPALNGVSTVAGRILLPLAGIGNTVLSAAVFGVQSGVEVFLIPCALIACLLFRPNERMATYAVVLLAILSFTVFGRFYGEPAHAYTGEEYADFVALNAFSAGMLSCFIGLLGANLIAAARR